MVSRVTVAALLPLGTALLLAQSPAPVTPGPATRPAVDPADYQLVWSDEFDKEGPLDPAKWRFENGFVRNQEHQWYQPDNAVCKDGILRFEARREKRPNPRYEPGSSAWQTSREFIEYTSSSANTRGLASWLYGRFEIRAKVDARKGAWPAIWMLGNAGRWPANGEIDIMEYYSDHILANFCWVAPSGRQAWNTGKFPMATFAADFAEKFHTWRMDWDERQISIFIDDKLYNTQDLSKTLNRGDPADNPFKRPMYLLLNLAIGGTNGGDPSNTRFPITYEVDYVRIYQTPAQQAATKAALAAQATQPATGGQGRGRGRGGTATQRAN